MQPVSEGSTTHGHPFQSTFFSRRPSPDTSASLVGNERLAKKRDYHTLCPQQRRGSGVPCTTCDAQQSAGHAVAGVSTPFSNVHHGSRRDTHPSRDRSVNARGKRRQRGHAMSCGNRRRKPTLLSMHSKQRENKEGIEEPKQAERRKMKNKTWKS